MILRHLCIAGVAAVGLVACGEPVAAPAGGAPAAPAATSASSSTVILDGEGLRVSSAPAVIVFGAPRATVEAALTAAFGAAPTASENPDCPTGTTQDLTWGGLTVVTRDGAFIGWSTSPGAGPQTASGAHAGMTRAEALAMAAREEDDSQFPVTPIFVDGVSGFLDQAGAVVDQLYAGDVCIAS